MFATVVFGAYPGISADTGYVARSRHFWLDISYNRANRNGEMALPPLLASRQFLARESAIP